MYKHKYLKYREKYLKLRENQTGGGRCASASPPREQTLTDSLLSGAFFDLNSWSAKNYFRIDGDRVINGANNDIVGLLTIDENRDAGNFMLYLLSNLFGRDRCPEVRPEWITNFKNPDKKIYIIDYANLYHITYDQYKEDRLPVGRRLNLGDQSADEIARFRNVFSNKMRQFLIKRIINWDSMVIIINKTIGPNGIDPNVIVEDTHLLHEHVGGKLIVLDTSYMDIYTHKKEPIPGCIDDFCFWMIVIGLVGIFTKIISHNGNVNVADFDVNAVSGRKLDYYMRKLRLVTNDKQKIGILAAGGCEDLAANPRGGTPFPINIGVNKTIFSHLMTARLPDIRITCTQLTRTPGGIMFLYNNNTVNYLNIFFNICRNETVNCYDIARVPNGDENRILHINSHPIDYCRALTMRIGGRSVMDEVVNIVRCTVPITSMKFAFVTLIAKIQKLIGYTETSMRQTDMVSLLFNNMD